MRIMIVRIKWMRRAAGPSPEKDNDINNNFEVLRKLNNSNSNSNNNNNTKMNTNTDDTVAHAGQSVPKPEKDISK